MAVRGNMKITYHMVLSPIYNPCTRSNARKIFPTLSANWLVSQWKTFGFWRAATEWSPRLFWQLTLMSNSRSYILTITITITISWHPWLFSECDLADTFISVKTPARSWWSSLSHFPLSRITISPCPYHFSSSFCEPAYEEVENNTDRKRGEAIMAEVCQHWKDIVFPHVEYLCTDRPPTESYWVLEGVFAEC